MHPNNPIFYNTEFSICIMTWFHHPMSMPCMGSMTNDEQKTENSNCQGMEKVFKKFPSGNIIPKSQVNQEQTTKWSKIGGTENPNQGPNIPIKILHLNCPSVTSHSGMVYCIIAGLILDF